MFLLPWLRYYVFVAIALLQWFLLLSFSYIYKQTKDYTGKYRHDVKNFKVDETEALPVRIFL